MSTNDPLVIELQKMEGSVYSGRPEGELARKKFNLDKIDKEHRKVIVRIPESTYAVTTSFFLGLFGKSIRQAGSRSAFLGQYEIQAPEVFRNAFESYISRALQEHRASIRENSRFLKA